MLLALLNLINTVMDRQNRGFACKPFNLIGSSFLKFNTVKYLNAFHIRLYFNGNVNLNDKVVIP